MLQHYHNSRKYNSPKLTKRRETSAELDFSATARDTLIWSATKKDNESIRIRTALDHYVDPSEVDALREPLAKKRLLGETLTDREAITLDFLDEQLCQFFEPPTPLPKEVKWAMREAERFLRRK